MQYNNVIVCDWVFFIHIFTVFVNFNEDPH